MFGLVSKKKYERLESRLTNAIIVNKANDIRIKEFEDKLKLEVSKASYWKSKSENPNAELYIVGTEAEIA